MAKTPNGNVERGYGQQRQFVRAVEQVEGVRMVISHSSGTVRLAVMENSALDAVDALTDDCGGDVSMSHTGSPPTRTYPDGSLVVNVKFESGP
jgi:hypothetical protein